MSSQAETVLGWLNGIKTQQGQKQFMKHHFSHAILLAKQIGSDELTETNVQLVRILRNCVPLGEEAVGAIVRGGVIPTIVRALMSHLRIVPEMLPTSSILSTMSAWKNHCSDGLLTSFLVASSQLFANLASAETLGAAEVWSHCFPVAFQYLLKHPSAPIHQAIALALYSCCRQDRRCSLALCAVEADLQQGPAAPCSDLAGTTISTGDGEALSTRNIGIDDSGHSQIRHDGPCGQEFSVSTAGVANRDNAIANGSATAECLAGHAECKISAAAAVRPIWESLLLRVMHSVPPPVANREPPGSGAGAGGGSSSDPDFTALLCGCVALRQGLLQPLLELLALPSPRTLGWVAEATAFADDGDCDAGGVVIGAGRDVTASTGKVMAVAAASTSAPEPSTSAPEPSTSAPEPSTSAPEATFASAYALLPGPIVASTSAPASTATASTSKVEATSEKQGDDVVQTSKTGSVQCRFRSLHPVLLHILAQELYDLRGSGTVDIGEWAAAATIAAADETQSDDAHGISAANPAIVASVRHCSTLAALPHVVRPLAAALMHMVEVVDATARHLAVLEAYEALHPGRDSRDGVATGARGLASHERTESSCGLGGGGGAADTALAAAVMEAGLEALKSATQREDGGRAIFGGLDMAEWLLIEGGLLPKLLGMLAALQPAATLRASRRRRAAAAAAATSSNRQCQQPPQSPLQPDSDRPVVELPYELKALAAGFPGAVATAAAANGGDAPPPPYMGYRGDLVSMLSNGAYRRPRVASALLASGGLELLLAQTHLDDHSPLAREWALWGVRNLCESSEEVQDRIAGMELQTAVETPELRQLGMRLELDKATGKLKVSNTEDAATLLDGGRSGIH